MHVLYRLVADSQLSDLRRRQTNSKQKIGSLNQKYLNKSNTQKNSPVPNCLLARPYTNKCVLKMPFLFSPCLRSLLATGSHEMIGAAAGGGEHDIGLMCFIQFGTNSRCPVLGWAVLAPD